MNKNNGFTLIELMIVVAIIGILAAVAIPKYQEFIARAQLSEAVNIINGLKIDFTSSYGETGVCPINGTAGYNTASEYAGKYVAKVDFAGAIPSVADSTCSLIATFKTQDVSPSLSGKKLIIAMIGSQTGSSWELRQSMTQGDIPPAILPYSLR